MDWFTFVTKLLETFAWPAVTVTIFLLLRKPVIDAFAALETFKGKISSVELEFKRVLAAAREGADQAGLPSALEANTTTSTTTTSGPGAPTPPITPIERYKRLIEISPRAGILDAWIDIETNLNNVAICQGIPSDRAPLHIISELVARGCLTRRTESLLDELRVLRNEVVHGQNLTVSTEDATDYAMIAVRLISRLQEMR